MRTYTIQTTGLHRDIDFTVDELQCDYTLTIQLSKHDAIIINTALAYNIDLQLCDNEYDACVPVYDQHKNSKRVINYLMIHDGDYTLDAIQILIDIMYQYGDYIDITQHDIYNIFDVAFC